MAPAVGVKVKTERRCTSNVESLFVVRLIEACTQRCSRESKDRPQVGQLLHVYVYMIVVAAESEKCSVVVLLEHDSLVRVCVRERVSE